MSDVKIHRAGVHDRCVGVKRVPADVQIYKCNCSIEECKQVLAVRNASDSVKRMPNAGKHQILARKQYIC